MTDAAVSITQSVVEAFTERYLESIGSTIEKQDDEWTVTIPDSGNVGLPGGEITLHIGEEREDETGEALHPESEYFHRVLEEASQRQPVGKLTVETDQSDVEVPQWLEGSDVRVNNIEFTPYYDRTAIVVLFKVSIETVSEYQQESLRAIAADSRSEQRLPALEETFLEITATTSETTATTGNASMAEDEARSLLDSARDRLMDDVQAEIDRVHHEASRAADAEVEEYRQLQQQRIQELKEKRSKLSSKIDELSEEITQKSQDERVAALKDRKEAKAEYEEVASELQNLQERRDQGFPQQQTEIRNRHSLDVHVKPLTITQTEYERGELDIEVAEHGTTRTITIGYGNGIGLTETLRCSSCNREFSAKKPIHTITDTLQCRQCASTNHQELNSGR